MGNCLNLFSSEDPAWSSAFSFSAMKRPLLAADGGSHLLPKRQFDCFAPILPFRTPSDLDALYELGPELGRGQFGIIRKCTERASGTCFACKSISKLRMCSLYDIKDVICEINIMKRLSDPTSAHKSALSSRPNIVHLHEVVEDSAFVHLIVELCNGGELFDRIAKVKFFPEAQAALLMKSLLETLRFCHSMGIMHRDLKPENVLFINESDDSNIKLADFGLALEFTPGQKFSGMAGSAYYMAPELLQGQYSEEIDVWSAGVIMYVLLCGMPPFWGHTDEDIFQAIQHGQLDLTSGVWETISQQAKDLIIRMLCVNVELRCTPSEALDHPWFMQHTTAKIGRAAPSSVTDKNQEIQPDRNFEPSFNLPALTSLVKVTHRDLEYPKTLDTLPTASLASMDGCKPMFNTSEIDCTKHGLNKLKMALAACLDAQKFSLTEILSKLRLKTGWTCTLITTSAAEESLMIDMGHQRYLILHDRLRKRICVKALKAQWSHQKGRKVTSSLSLQKLQPVSGLAQTSRFFV